MDIQFEITVPVVTFEVALFKKRVQKATERELDISQRLLEKTHRSWNTPVSWRRSRAYRLNRYGAPTSIVGAVWTDNDTYNLVAKGAVAHTYSARRGAWLRYQKNFRSKTRPRVIGSRGGGKYGEWIKRHRVTHPGHAARDFHLEIAERRQEKYQKAVGGEFVRVANGFFRAGSGRAGTAGFSTRS